MRTTFDRVAPNGPILALFDFWRVLRVGEGAGELLGGSEGSGCGQLSIELPRTEIFLLSLIFGGSFGWGKVLGNCWEGVRGLRGENADNFPLSCCERTYSRSL